MTTRRTCIVICAILALSTMALPAAAQTSKWPQMTLAGDMTGWNNPPNMILISNNLWMVDLYCFSTPRMAFKFHPNNNWDFQWGETNQDQFVPPFTFVADYNAPYGADIVMSNLTSGIYRFLFDDSTGTSSVEKIQDVSASYSRMAVAGGMNGWSKSPNMTLVSNYTWQADLYVSASPTYFKFVPEDDWGLNWGESNQTWFAVPMTNTAEFKADNGRDCRMNISSSGIYRFTFVDTNGQYSIRCISGGRANYAAMAVAGNFNGWSVLPNMQLVADNTWQTAIDFVDRDTIYFKYAANGSWSSQWGDTNATLFDAPIMGTAEAVEHYDFQINGPLNGRYYFRFNDQTRYYEVFPDGVVETFNNWQPAGSYGTYTNNGWVAYNAIISSSNSRYGICVRLQDSLVTNQWLRSPFLPGGVTRVSFWLRSWNTNDPAMDYDLQTSTNGSDWTTFATISDIRTLTYANYSYDLNLTNGVYVRLKHNGGGNRLLIDDFVIVLPFADVLISDVALTPAYPWSNETVSVSAIVATNILATNLVVSMNYRVGSTGTYSSISMTGVTNYFTTSSSIPAKPSGTRIYYYLTASFGGPGGRSPVFWPSGGSNSPAWYGVTHNRHGSVWINEVNYEPYTYLDTNTWESWITQDTNEFVELCGLAGSDIGHWTIELLDVYTPYASYTVPDNTLLPPETNGFGFFVLGDSILPNIDMVFTNTIIGMRSLMERGAIRLRNEFGASEYIFSYGDPHPTNIANDAYMGIDHYYTLDDLTLGLTGVGSNYSSMSWTTNGGPTIGFVNSNQTLIGGNLSDLPSLTNAEFVATYVAGQIYLWIESTNGWNAAPYYTTAITNTWPTAWTPITPFQSYYADGMCQLSFSMPSNSGSKVFFRTLTTRTW